MMPVAAIELADEVEPLTFAAGDLIEILFQLRGERNVDQIAEMGAQQTRDGKRRETRHERLPLTEDVAAPLDGANRRCVGRWAADPEPLELFDERCLCVARRRCRLMTLRFQIEQMKARLLVPLNAVANGEFGQRAFLLAEFGDGIVTSFDIRAAKPREFDHLAGR